MVQDKMHHHLQKCKKIFQDLQTISNATAQQSLVCPLQVERCLEDLAIVWITLDAICSVGESNMAAKSTTRWARGSSQHGNRSMLFYSISSVILAHQYFTTAWQNCHFRPKRTCELEVAGEVRINIWTFAILIGSLLHFFHW